MAVYLGYYRVVRQFQEQTQAQARDAGVEMDAKFRQMILALPDRLPAGCTIVGSYTPIGGGAVLHEPGPPAVMIVETESTRDLVFISQYYTGYLQFEWTPATR